MTYSQGAAGNAPCGHDTIPNRLTREGFRAAEQALRRGDCPLAAECLSFARLFIKVDASERLGPDDLSAFCIRCWMRSVSLTCSGTLLSMVLPPLPLLRLEASERLRRSERVMSSLRYNLGASMSVLDCRLNALVWGASCDCCVAHCLAGAPPCRSSCTHCIFVVHLGSGSGTCSPCPFPPRAFVRPTAVPETLWTTLMLLLRC